MAKRCKKWQSNSPNIGHCRCPTFIEIHKMQALRAYTQHFELYAGGSMKESIVATLRLPTFEHRDYALNEHVYGLCRVYIKYHTDRKRTHTHTNISWIAMCLVFSMEVPTHIDIIQHKRACMEVNFRAVYSFSLLLSQPNTESYSGDRKKKILCNSKRSREDSRYCKTLSADSS